MVPSCAPSHSTSQTTSYKYFPYIVQCRELKILATVFFQTIHTGSRCSGFVNRRDFDAAKPILSQIKFTEV